MTRLPAAAVSVCLVAVVAVAQQPSTVSAEAVEYVRAKPDFAKLYLKVETRNTDLKAAAEEHDEAVKKAVEAIGKLKLKGVKVTPLASQVAKTETDVRAAFAPGQPREPRTLVQYLNTGPLLVTVSDAAPDGLEATVLKLQREAAQLGLGGDLSVRGALSSLSTGIERGTAPQVVYGRRDGWDELLAPAIEKATKRAVKKAELLAASAGLKPGEVLSVSDGSVAVPAATNRTARFDDQTEADEQTTYTDGELVRKVRVRVVLAAGR
jgi:uncharacterized protein YggE